jgi:hypothetical protein
MGDQALTRRGLTWALALGTAALSTDPVKSQPLSDADEVKVGGTETVRQFVADVQALGLAKSGAVPEVIAKSTLQLSVFSSTNMTITLPAWSETPPPIQGLMNSIASPAGLMSGRQLFSSVFNWFLIIHELTHWLEFNLAWRARKLDLYDTEVRCNRVAIAFWMKREGGPQRLATLMQTLAKAESVLPSPVPVGQDARAYFNTHYQELGANPPAYGWYQFHMFLAAWAQRDEADFPQLIRAMQVDRPPSLKPVDTFFAAFNRGDWEAATACFGPDQTVIDETPPFGWSGHDAFKAWLKDNLTLWARTGLKEVKLDASEPLIVRTGPSSAYIVVPTVERFVQHGQAQAEKGFFTFLTRPVNNSWLISSMTWTRTDGA